MINYTIRLLTIVMLWGCITFRYVGNAFSIAMIAFALLACIILLQKKGKSFYRIDGDLGKALISLYGTILIVSLFQENAVKNIVDSAYGSLTLFFITMPLWMVLYVGHQYDIRKWIIYVTYGNMYAFSLYGLFKYFSQNESRLSSFYGSPPEVGMLLDLFIPFTIAFAMLQKQHLRWKVASLILIVLEVLSVVLTETRGSYMALCAGIIVSSVMYIWMNRNCISLIKKLILGITVILFCFAFGGYSYHLSVESESRMVGGERLLLWDSSYHMWEDHKLLGIGFSEWREAYNNPESKYHPLGGKETTNVMPHNIYIYFAATGGIISLIGLCGYIFFMFRYLLRKIHMQKNNPMNWAMLSMFVALMVHGLVDGTLISKHIGRVFYLMMGVGIIFTEIMPAKIHRKSEHV